MFDATTSFTMFYYNGYLDSFFDDRKPEIPIDDYSRTEVIGNGQLYNDFSEYYDGLTDQVTFLFRRRDESDILNEATLLAHYAFQQSISQFL